jgi:hypothetical protein
MFCDLFCGNLAKGQNDYSILNAVLLLALLKSYHLLKHHSFCDLRSSWIFCRGVKISFSPRSLKSHYWFSSCRRILVSDIPLCTVSEHVRNPYFLLEWMTDFKRTLGYILHFIYLSLIYKQVMRFKFWGYCIGVVEGSVLFDRMCVIE